MKSTINKWLVIGLLLIGTAALSDTLHTENEKAAYSLGFTVSKQILSNEKNLNRRAYLLGVKAAFDDAETIIDEDEMQNKIRAWEKRQAEPTRNNIVEPERNNLSVEDAKRLSKGREFLAENSRRADVFVLVSGLQYEVLEGGSGDKPESTNTVEVNYQGYFIDGEMFDASSRPARFPVNRVIKGWTEALQLMRVGSKWKLFIPPELGYGHASAGGIPPYSVLIFEVELLDIKQ